MGPTQCTPAKPSPGSRRKHRTSSSTIIPRGTKGIGRAEEVVTDGNISLLYGFDLSRNEPIDIGKRCMVDLWKYQKCR